MATINQPSERVPATGQQIEAGGEHSNLQFRPVISEFQKQVNDSYRRKLPEISENRRKLQELREWRDMEISQEISGLLEVRNAVKSLETGKPHYLAKELSPRELELVKYLCQGRTVSQSARLMKVDRRTAATFRRRVAQKLKVKTTLEIIQFSIQCGLVDASVWMQRRG